MTLLISLLLLAGCDRPSAAECLDNTMCEPGFVCYEQACRAAECTDSTQCGIQQYCDPRSFRCSDGCLTADDTSQGDTSLDARRCCRSIDVKACSMHGATRSSKSSASTSWMLAQAAMTNADTAAMSSDSPR